MICGSLAAIHGKKVSDDGGILILWAVVDPVLLWRG